MQYKGVSKSRRKGMWVARTRLNGRVKTIGEFYTPEQASEAYIKFKQTVEREFTANDLARLARYKAYVNFCEEPKRLPEFFAEFNKSGSSAVRDLVNYLVRNNFIKQETAQVAGKVIEAKEISVVSHFSPPLKQLVYWCNQKSLNLYAEAFCKTMS
jgi:D-alanyl-D-alanine carboxypeptidase